MNEITQAFEKLKELIDTHLKTLETDMRIKNTKLDEKMKSSQAIDIKFEELRKEKEFLAKQRALIEAEKAKNKEKEDFLSRKEEKIAEKTARLQQFLNE